MGNYATFVWAAAGPLIKGGVLVMSSQTKGYRSGRVSFSFHYKSLVTQKIVCGMDVGY
jgi:hypothetical protein